MTFGEWWKANSFKFPQADLASDGHKEVAKAAWNAAVAEVLRVINAGGSKEQE